MESRESSFQENLRDCFMIYVKEDKKATEGERQTPKLTKDLKVCSSFQIHEMWL